MHTLSSPRLDLVSLSPDFLATSLRGDRTADDLPGVSIPPDWYDEGWLIKIRLADFWENRTWQPWSLRAVVLRETQTLHRPYRLSHPARPRLSTRLCPWRH